MNYLINKGVILLALLFLNFMTACSKTGNEPLLPDVPQEEVNTDLSQAEQEVLAMLDIRDKAMIDRDIETLGSLMADDLILVHITGRQQSKAEWLEEIRSENMRYYDIKRENFKMEINGNRATATYVSVLDARIYGSRNVWRLNVTMPLEKRDGAWIWVNPW